MIAVKHGAFTFLLRDRRGKAIMVDLNFDGAQAQRNLKAQCLAIDNIAAFHRNDFVFDNIGRGKQTAPVDFTLTHFRFRREVGETKHLATR